MEPNMQYIYEVYREGSLSRAAEKLYLTQPALSMAIRREEKAIGAAIFDRGRRPLTLTPAGEAYIRAAERMRYLEADLGRELEDLRTLHTGRLHIGGTHYINCFVLAGLLAGFAQSRPGIQLEVSEDSSARLADRMEQHDLDLIFSCADELVARFEHRPAFYDHILLAVPRGTALPSGLERAALTAEQITAGRHLRADCPRVPLGQFEALPFVLMQQGNNLYDRCARMFAAAGFAPKVKLALSQLVTAYRFAENGIGATFVSDRIVRASPSSDLLFYSPDSPEADRLFYILQPPRSYTADAVKAFIGYALEWFKGE